MLYLLRFLLVTKFSDFVFRSLGKPNQVQRLLCEDVAGWIPFVSIPQSHALFADEESTTLLVLRLSASYS